MQVREDLQQSVARPCWEKHRQTPAAAPDSAPAAPKQPIVLYIDGEYDQMRIMMEVIVEYALDQGGRKDFPLLKLSAACSKTQQPADVSPCFWVLKKVFDEVKDSLQLIAYRERYMDKVDEVLQVLDANAREQFTNFLAYLPAVLSKAFTKSNVMLGWTKSGLFPFDVKGVLMQCTSYHLYEPREIKPIVAAVHKLVPVVLEKGQLTDAEIHAAVGGAEKLDKRPPLMDGVQLPASKRTKDQSCYVLGHRRALCITHGLILKAEAEIEARKAAKKAAKCAAAVSQDGGQAPKRSRKSGKSKSAAAPAAMEVIPGPAENPQPPTRVQPTRETKDLAGAIVSLYMLDEVDDEDEE